MSHLTYEERLIIQQDLKFGKNFSQIAKHIKKDRTTVSREVFYRRHSVPAKFFNNCAHRTFCTIYHKCSVKCNNYSYCGVCGKCIKGCKDYKKESCRRLTKPPYVCNGCDERRCGYERFFYYAREAQKEYSDILRTSREGIAISDEELDFLEKNVVPLIKSGCSIPVACHEFKDQMPISEKTMYEYVNKGLFSIGNMDMRRKCRRSYKKKTGPVLRVDKECHIDRTYMDYERYKSENPEQKIVQMDSVIGRTGGKVLLTIFLTDCDMQLYYLRDRNTAESVSRTFKMLRETLGEDFKKIFQICLTDRGSEFTDPLRIECDEKTGELQCRVFYCEPMDSNQKSNCERNHEIFRYVSPKGKSFDHCNQEMITEASCHINSYPRKSLGWKSPIDLFVENYGEEALKKLGLRKITIDQLQLRESLLNP